MRFALAVPLCFVSFAAFAATMEVRPSEPVAEFNVPDDWTTTRTDRGLQVVSKDKEVYFWLEAYKPSEFDAILAEHNNYWKDQGVAIKSTDEQKHAENGKEVSMVTEHETWNGAPTVLYYVEYHLGLKFKLQRRIHLLGVAGRRQGVPRAGRRRARKSENHGTVSSDLLHRRKLARPSS